MSGLDANTKLLMHMDGDNDGVVFSDSSTSNLSIDVLGSVVTTTVVPKFGTASLKCIGSGYATPGNCLRIPYNSALGIQGDFTIDFWMKSEEIFYGCVVNLLKRYSGTSSLLLNITNYSGDPYMSFAITGGSKTLYKNFFAYDDNAWHHIAIVGYSGSLYLYIDGTVMDSGASTAWNDTTDTVPWYIGSVLQGPADDPLLRIDEFRYSNVARWVSNFTPDTEPYSATFVGSTTKLLLNMDGVGQAFIDSSVYAHTVLVSGAVEQNTVQYQIGTASAEFESNADFLAVEDVDKWDIFNAPFTIDFWFYPDAVSGNQMIFSQAQDRGNCLICTYNHSTGTFHFSVWRDWVKKIGIDLNVTLTLQTWMHIAIVGNWE